MEDSFETEETIHGGRVYRAARRWGVPIGRIVDFSANINASGPPQGVTRLPPDVWEQIASYPDATDLVEALSEKHGIPSRCILVSNGSAAMIFHAARALRPRSALLLEPAFSEYHRAMVAAGVNVNSYLLKEERTFLPDFDELLEAVRETHSGLVVLNSPHNPTGAIYSPGQMTAFADVAAELGAFVMFDQAFIDYAEIPDPRGFVVRSNVVAMRSLTKFYAMPGLRVGYAFCHQDLAALIGKQVEAWPVSNLALWAAKEAIADYEFERNTRSLNEEAREEFYSALAQAGLTVYPSAANFLLVKLPGRRAAELARWIERDRILIRLCDSFRGLDDRFLRLAVRSRTDNLRLVDLIRDWLRYGNERTDS
jgi:threonine-phosphate decarboxylase